MKKLMAILFATMLAGQAWAYDFQSGDLYYNITSSNEPYTVEVTYQSNYSSLISVAIPEKVTYSGIEYSVTTIGDGAFYGCSSLVYNEYDNAYYLGNDENLYLWLIKAKSTEITSCAINENCKFIYSGAFAGCSGLTAVTIPNSVTYIGHDAFQYCSDLTSVTIPNSVTYIDIYAFVGCSSLVYNEYDNAYYLGNTENPYLWLIKAKSAEITSCAINENCKFIYYYAISGCSKLTSVIIPESVTIIGHGAFNGCSSLTTVTIPNSVTTISDQAFWGCSKLTSVIIPESVTTIGDYVFHDCSSLTSVTIPNSVTTIGNNAFEYCDGLTSVTIPNSVINIGYNALYGCWSLVYNEYDNAYYLGNAENQYLLLIKAKSKDITTCAINENCKFIYYGAFEGCNGLTTVTIPNSVTSIGDYAFYGCCGLTSVTIPNSVTYIGKSAFHSCSNLFSVTIPNSVTAIGDYAFSGIKNIVYAGSAIGKPWGAKSCGIVADEDGFVYGDRDMTQLVAYIGNASNITIPNIVTEIGADAFNGCSGLTSVTIPNSVSYIGCSAFHSCISLETVNFNAQNCITMGSYSSPVFSLCTSLKTINLGANVENIPSCAFSGCSKLTSVIIPESVTSIGGYAFNGCSSLTTVTIPNSVTNIGYNAFYGCSSLVYNEYDNAYYLGNDENLYLWLIKAKSTDITTCTINENCKFIYYGAFEGCNGLTTVTIPNSVTYIGESAFSGCSSLISISLPFVGDKSHLPSEKFEYPFGYIFGSDSYEGGTLTTNYSVNSMTYLPFYIPTALKEVIITGSSYIPYGAFYNCIGLTSVTIPESVTNIGDFAFYGCNNIASVTTTCNANFMDADLYFIKDKIKYRVKNKNEVEAVDNPNHAVIPEMVTAGNTFSVRESPFLYWTTQAISNKFDYETNIVSIKKVASANTWDCQFNPPTWYAPSRGQSETFEFSFDAKYIGDGTFDDKTGLITFNQGRQFGYYRGDDAVIADLCRKLGVDVVPAGYKWKIESMIEQMLVTEQTDATDDFVPGKLNRNVKFYPTTEWQHFSFTGTLGRHAVDSIDISIELGKMAGEFLFKNIVFSVNGEVFANYFMEPLNDDFFKYNIIGREACVVKPIDTNLETANIPTTIMALDKEVPVTSIGEGAFSGCRNLTTVIIPMTITKIGEKSFKNCGLTSITIPNTVTSIGSNVFEGCDNLQYSEYDNALYLGNKENPYYALIKVKSNAKSNDLTTCEINERCRVIAAGAFQNCENIETIVIPDSIITIGHSAFIGCINLKSIHLANESVNVNKNAFSDCSNIVITASNPKNKHFVMWSDGVTTNPRTIGNMVENVTAIYEEHTIVTDNGAPATCIKTGITEGKHCEICGAVLVAQTEIPKAEHTAIADAGVAATCMATGLTEGSHCSVCGEVLVAQNTIPAIGHKEVTDAAIAATCVEPGKTAGKHCSVCNATIVAQTEIPALGHEFVTYVYNNDATAEANGTETAVCEHGCGATDTRVAEGTKLATTVSKSTANAVNIYAHGHTIIIENATDEILVYDAMGRIVGRDVARNVCTIKINNSGVYIVKTGGMVKRVMVN